MDALPAITSFFLTVSGILTAICLQQVLITPPRSKHAESSRSLLVIRSVNLLLASAETMYIALCLAEMSHGPLFIFYISSLALILQNILFIKFRCPTATRRLSEARFVSGVTVYCFLSLSLLLFALDRLSNLYQIHIDEAVPIWVRTLCITLCCIFNLTLLITFAVSLYSLSSFYWELQLIQLKVDVVVCCVVGIVSVAHIYYRFNQQIQSYLDAILAQHSQLQQIEEINHKLLDPHRRRTGKRTTSRITKEDVLTNNLILAAKIREGTN